MAITLVGNKTDIESERQISTEEGQKFANEHNLMFIETSAKNISNVDRAFILTARKILEEIEIGNFDLSNENSGIKMGYGLPKNLVKNEKKCSC